MLNTKRGYYTFLVILYMFVFQFAIMQYLTVFKYLDELYAVLSIPLFFWAYRTRLKDLFSNSIKKKVGNIQHIRQLLKTTKIKLLIAISIFVLIGLIGNIVYGYQGFIPIAIDVLLNVKFVLGIFTTYYIFKSINIMDYKKEISKHVHIIIMVLVVLLLVDIVFEVFPCYEIRYGLRSKQLYYTHPTELASVSFFLLLINVFFSEKYDKKEIIFIILASILVASSLRLKAIAIVVVFLVIWFWIGLMKKQLKPWHILVFAPVAIYIAWDQVYFYFFSDVSRETVRGALSFTSIEILKDYFPIGTGLGTFASAPSGDYYSKVYEIYGISDIWGLTPEWPEFVSDCFWPMILGQTGFLGLVTYVYILVVLFKELNKSFGTNKRVYLAGLGALVYLVISSVAESAFVNPLALPLSVVIGLCFIYQNKQSQEMM